MGLVPGAPNAGSGDFQPVAEGTHVAVCSQIVDLGSHYSEQFGKWNHQVLIGFQLPEETVEVEGKKIPRTVSKTFGLSLHEKATLRKTLESWRAKKFTDKELASFDLQQLLSRGCQISIVHNKKDDKCYANINAIIALPKGMAVPALHGDPVFYSLQEEGNDNVFEALPEWMREKIEASKEWKAKGAIKPEGRPEDAGIDDEPVEDAPF